MEKDEELRQYFEKGKTLRRRLRFRAACLVFQKAAEIAPPSAGLLVEWGQALFGKKDFAGAVEKYQKASELDPKRAEIYALWGRALTAHEDYPKSAENYAKAVSLGLLNTDAYLGWADALWAQEKWEEAIDVYEKAIEADPGSPRHYDLFTALEKLPPDEKAKAVQKLESKLTSDARYALALTYWGTAFAQQGRFDKALEQYRRALHVNPAFVGAYLQCGGVLLEQGEYTKAFNCYYKAIELGPDQFPFRYIRRVEQAIANLKTEESAAATRRLTELLGSDPRNAMFYLRWGRSLARRKLYPEAINRYQEACNLNPRLVDAFLGWGEALAAQNKRDNAIERYSQAAQLEPGSAEAYRGWADVLSSQGKFTQAAAQYRRAIENDKSLDLIDFSEVLELLDNLNSEERARTLQVLETALARVGLAERYIAWGDALSGKERYAEALPQYEKARQIDDKAPATWRKVAEAQRNLGEYPSAVESYRKMWELDPYEWSACVGWGWALFDQRKFSEAIEKYRQASELMDNPAEAYYCWGQALVNQRRYGEAIECYMNALQADPDYVAAYVAWGWALHSQEKYDEAIEQYKKAIERPPEYAPAHNNWGFALAAQQKYDEAVAEYEKALDLNPKDPYTCLGLGNALDAQGRHEEAIAVYQQAIEHNESFAYASHNIAACLWNRGQYGAGRKAWEEAREVYEKAKHSKENRNDPDFFRYYGSVLHQFLWDLAKSEEVLLEGLKIDPDDTGVLSALISLYLDRHDEPPPKGNKGGRWRPLYRFFRRRQPSPGEDTSGDRPPHYWKARKYFLKAERILKQRLATYEDSASLRELGDLYLMMREYDEAETHLEKALKKDPKSPAAYVSLGVLCSRKEDFRPAVQYFEGAYGQDPNDLDAWSNLAEAYLKLNPKELKQIEKAEREFRKILQIAPEHIDSLIGLGEVYTAMAEVGEKDFYQDGIKRYSEAIRLATAGKGSKHLKTRDLAAVYYSCGYARVKLYEASKPFGDESLLKDALEDFRQCADRDPGHCKAERARDQLEKRRRPFSRRWFEEKVARWLVLVPSLFVLVMTQLTFFFGVPPLQKPIQVASYITLTFGSLIFVVVGIFLPEIQKLKGAGIELEKGTVTQISTSGLSGISK
jgi:tetratricopeptide (TPR) repeat protein